MTHDPNPNNLPLAEDCCMECGAAEQYDDCRCDPDAHGAVHCRWCCQHAAIVETITVEDVGLDVVMISQAGVAIGVVMEEHADGGIKAAVRGGARYYRVGAPSLDDLPHAIAQAQMTGELPR